MIHELKTLPQYFDAIREGTKIFEVRRNDRNYRVGDILALNEYANGEYTGRSCVVWVDYILLNSEYSKEGYVIMSIKPCTLTQSFETDYRVPIVYSCPGSLEVSGDE